jgi:hypothetical protein
MKRREKTTPSVSPPPPHSLSLSPSPLLLNLLAKNRFHAGAFYALAPPAALPALRACLGPAPSLPIAALPVSDGAAVAAALHAPAWLPGRTASLAAPARYEPGPHTALDAAGAWTVAGLAVGLDAGEAFDTLLVAGTDRGPGPAAGLAVAALALGPAPAPKPKKKPAALFRDDVAALAGGGWLGFEAVVVPVGAGEGGGGGGGPRAGGGAAAFGEALQARAVLLPRLATHVPPNTASSSTPLPSLVLYAPARPARLADSAPLATALASAAAAAGLEFRLVDGAEGSGSGGSDGNATTTTPPPPPTPTRALASLTLALAGARVVVGRGAPDLAAAAAAAPPGCALLELVPVEGHPAVGGVVAARSAGSQATVLASHEVWAPHPPGGAVGPHLAWADPGDGARYGGWARPDCAAGVLHGGECAAAAGRAGLSLADPGDVASIVDAALRGLYAAEAAVGVGLAGDRRVELA